MAAGELRIAPANMASCADLEAIFGRRGEAARCLCQRIRLPHRAWHEMSVADRARLRAQTACGDGQAGETTGLGGAPAGLCASGPRPDFLHLLQSRSTVPWAGRPRTGAPARWRAIR